MNINEAVQLAFKHHQAGNLHQAELSYKKILKNAPNNFDSLHMLGVLYSQLKEYDLAIKYIKMAITIKPHSAFAIQNLGNVFVEKKQFGKAIECFNTALTLNPANGDLYCYLGNIFITTKQNDKAMSCYEKAIQFKTNNINAFINLGILLQKKGKLREAINNYQKAIELNPYDVDVYNNIGVAFKDIGQLDKAFEYYQKALTLNPDNFRLHNNLGLILEAKRQFQNAINHYRKALRLNPNFIESYLNLGNALKVLENTLDARISYDLAIFFSPSCFTAHFAKCIANLRMLYMHQSEIAESRENYSKELFQLAESLNIATPEDIKEAVEAIGSHQPFCLAYHGMNDRDLHKIYGDLVCRIMSISYPKFVETPSVSTPLPGELIRIGFVSGYFRLHSNWKIPIKGWIENLDKSKFELYGYFTGNIKDKVTAVARQNFKRFVEDIYTLEDLCEIIRNDNLHCIIYPEVGMNPITVRLAALRLAPIQCASWGHADTTGLPTIDYYLSSDLMEPPDADDHYTEKLVRLPNLSIYYDPLDPKPANVTRESYNLRKTSILYLCSHTPSTHLPQYDNIYPQIARQVKDCQFIFISHYQSKAVTEKFSSRINKAFEQFNLNGEEYVVILPHLDQEHFLAINRLSDVLLDTIGWSGCNSTFEALAFDLPVVTIPGELMRGRHTSGILAMLGLTETVATTLDEYVSLAVRLGKDLDFRQQISDKISRNKHCAYHDKICIRNLEAFLERVVQENLT